MKTIIKIILFIAFVSVTSAFDDTYQSLLETQTYLEKKVNVFLGKEVEEEKEEKRNWRLVIGTSFYTDHLKTDGMFEKNNLKQYGVEYKDWTVSYNGFINSYEKKSHMIMLDKKTYFKESGFYFKAGAGIVKGYEKEGIYITNKTQHYYEYVRFDNKFVVYKDYGLLGTIGLGYSIYDIIDIEVNLFGEAIIMGVRVRI